MQRLPIEEFLKRSTGNQVLDVRSPGEYLHAHIPGASNLPLFTDEERKIVGTSYKQESRQIAIKAGLDFFGPKMKKMVEEVDALVNLRAPRDEAGTSHIFIYCWRGGMRSSAVAWLLDLYGFRVYTLAGGYKAFRNYVLKSFEQQYRFNILGGYTGSAKTEVLNELGKRGEKVIDLEALACHKGSAFGSYKMPSQPTQEMFENLLSRELHIKCSPQKEDERESAAVWLEDESQRIGDINIPNPIWSLMRKSPLIFLDIPFEQRLDHLVEEYRDCPGQKLIDSTLRIQKRLGPLETKNTIAHLEAGELKQAFSYLLAYYDKLYKKGLYNRENPDALLTIIPCKKPAAENALLLTKISAI